MILKCTFKNITKTYRVMEGHNSEEPLVGADIHLIFFFSLSIFSHVVLVTALL